MSAGYVLLPAAEADLRAIIRYTRDRWGASQARIYIGRLEQAMDRLAAGQVPFKGISSLHPRLRTVRCEHHHIFCLPRDGEPAFIVAILHERMDLMSRLGDRLAGGTSLD